MTNVVDFERERRRDQTMAAIAKHTRNWVAEVHKQLDLVERYGRREFDINQQRLLKEISCRYRLLCYGELKQLSDDYELEQHERQLMEHFANEARSLGASL